MNVITTPHYNRPECTKALIRSLHNAIGIADWHVIFVCEPTSDEEVINLCKNSGLPSFEVIINKWLLGIWQNKKKCLHIGFERSDFVLHLEDDLMVSKDALLFYEWCKHTYRGQQSIFTVNGFNKIKAFDFYTRRCSCCNEPFYGEVKRRPSYNSIGFATWRDRYETMLSLHDWTGSDTSLEEYRNKVGLFEVYPTLSRINNIGFIQGSSFNDDVAKTLLKQNIRPSVLGDSTPDNIQYIERPKILANEHGNEWVKLDNNKCRSRKDPQYHKDNTYLSFWADSEEYKYGRFFE